MPIQVCYLIDNLAVAGTELFLLSLISHIDRSKVMPHLCLLNGEGEESRRIEPNNCAVVRLGVHSFRHPSTVLKAWRFRKFLRQNRIDILHTFFIDSAYFGAMVARAASVPVIIRTRRNAGHWLSGRHRWLERIFGRMATVTTTNAEAGRQSILADEPRARVEVIPNGVDVNRFLQISIPQPGIDRRSPRRVGIIANLRPVKNIESFIHAAKTLYISHPNTIFQIAGDGESRAELLALVRRLELDERVQFLGKLDDVRSFLAELDVAVLCSRSEGISNAILEYMSAARPIVATAVGGTPELLSNEETGLLVPPGDPQALAHAIGRLLSDSELSARLGKSAREAACQKYSREGEMQNYESLYQRLTERVDTR
jgi:Glycosyltransferase